MGLYKWTSRSLFNWVQNVKRLITARLQLSDFDIHQAAVLQSFILYMGKLARFQFFIPVSTSMNTAENLKQHLIITTTVGTLLVLLCPIIEYWSNHKRVWSEPNWQQTRRSDNVMQVFWVLHSTSRIVNNLSRSCCRSKAVSTWANRTSH